MALSRQKLWDAYSRGEEVRNELLESYLPLVKKVVGSLQVRLPDGMEEEDLIGYGVLGLLEAIKRFDSLRGTKFETYASSRIRGTILDELRRQGWVPRSVMEQVKQVQEAAEKLEQELQREVTCADIAGALNIPVKQVAEILEQVNFMSIIHLEELLTAEDSKLQVLDTVQSREPFPEQQVIEKDLKERLKEALVQLPERERLLLSLYYYEELTLKEIGEVMGISESRVSQIHSRALLRLRKILAGDDS